MTHDAVGGSSRWIGTSYAPDSRRIAVFPKNLRNVTLSILVTLGLREGLKMTDLILKIKKNCWVLLHAPPSMKTNSQTVSYLNV
jgi:hypothetical protein